MKARRVISQTAGWFERRWPVTMVSSVIVGAMAVTGYGDAWVYRVGTFMLCLLMFIEAVGNSLGLMNRWVPVKDETKDEKTKWRT